jgi:effector-binding domain-containing protein
MIEVLDALTNGVDTQSYEIVRAVEPESSVVGFAVETSWARVEQATRHALARLTVVLRRARIDHDAPMGALFAVAPDEDLEVTVFAAAPLDDDVGLSRVELPRVDAIATTHHGDHRLLGYAYHELLGQIAARGLEATGHAREYYLAAAQSDNARTRLVIPVSQNAP